MVLLDDSFASITAAIRQGRHMDDNIRAAMRFVFAVHVPVIGLAMVPVLVHWPALLLPAQIVLLELIIDPACSVMFEAEPAAANLMKRRPRGPNQSPFALANLAVGMLQGLGLAGILLLGCQAMFVQGWDAAAVRTLAFAALVGGIFLLAMAHRGLHRPSWTQSNPWVRRLLLGVAAMLALALGVPWARAVLGFAVPTAVQASAVAAILMLILGWLIAVRGIAHRFRRRQV
jgi:Ca2+-transporting ATPase